MKLIYLYVIVIGLLLLGIRYIFFFSQPQLLHDGDLVNLTTRLNIEPERRNHQQSFSLRISQQKLYIATAAYPEFHYGDYVVIRGKIQEKTVDPSGKTILKINNAEIKTSSNMGNIFYMFTIFVRRRVSMLFHESLSQKSAALLLGIVFGIKEQLPEDFLLALQKGGLMHVIAASGMNISMVANMLLLVFGKFLERKIAIFISIVCILFYAYLAGFEPSIVRAASMGIIGFSAALLGRQYYALSALLITAFGMLFLDPNLLFDVGFQLSFAATIGILFIQPLLTVDILFTHIQDQHNWIRNLPLIDDLKTTFAAQVATFPIIMVVFGQIGVLSLFVNLLVLWTIPPLMILGGIGALLGLFIPILGKAFILLTIPLLLFFEFITDFFGQFPTTLAVVSISWFFILGYYFMLFALVIFLQQKKYEKTSSNTH